jgi:large conductance mechanosensitive channel
MFKEFRAFVLRGNVVDLAIGVVIGAAFTAIVNAVVSGLINPLTSFIGTGDLDKKFWCAGGVVKTVDDCAHAFRYGLVLSAMLQFVIVAAVIFFAVVKPLNGLMERFKSDQPQEEATRECPECLSKIPRAARRCAYCTAEVGPAPGQAP